MPRRKETSVRAKCITDIIPSALTALEKTISNDLPYQHVPAELLVPGQRCVLDLSTWSLVATDDCLGVIATYAETSSLEVLNLSGAENITDIGLQSLSGCTSSLRYLNFDNAYQITGVGLARITKKCNKLQHLFLSGCMGIDGAGFGILGQNCRELVSLKLSGCRQIKPWAFMKIFESCKGLQSLDISFCALVTDQEMKVLADNASYLRQLNLRDCKLISDVGLSYLSLGCPQLSEINLRRSEMPFRITDVALLQLGQACQSLTWISLHGCEMISDIGLSWLAGGSKDLRHLDLSNCNKVTNSGIRHIGECCQNLRSIILSNLKRVSDIGVRCLATGCKHLEALNGSGMSMLSDGIDRSFSLEGMQALGHSNSSVTLKHLNLRGCSLVSTLTMKAIGNFSNLETLDLSGCDKLTLVGAICIGKACKRLSSLSFSSCGDCINDAMLEVIVNHLEHLSSANLSFCPKVSDRSLKALATCSRLETLDLTGCVGVSDQSILQLCEGHFSPGLRHLFLARCCKIGDTSLSWITQGLKQTLDGRLSLETLSLKGTHVTSTAVKGIRDRFPYSVLKTNSSFLGFWPLSRTDDRKDIIHYHKRACSAAVIQARVRSRKEKDTLKRAREEYSKKRVAILIGALYRGRKARRRYRDLKRLRKQRLASVLRIQCAFRCRLSRKKRLRLRERRWLTIAPLASCVIQRQWRGVLGRRKAANKREERRQQCQRQVEAAIRIQAWCRMLRAKRIKLLLLCRWFTGELNRDRAAIRVQCAWRMTQGVKELRRLNVEFMKQQRLESFSASRIVGVYRTFIFRKAVKHRVERTRKRLECALVIQRWWIGQKERILRNILAAALVAEMRLNASRLIQRSVRRRQAYLQLLVLRQERDDIFALREASATTICRFGRVCVAKIRMQRRRVEFDEEIRRSILLKLWASTKIAAGWRGKLGRDRAKAARVVRAQRWKAMFSSAEQKTFYYNQDTGETRWEKPQCLLDLEPKPVCCNCAEFLAEFDCADCKEFFCTTCFEFIHYGGRRQRHSFRTVYDYYGRRKDSSS
ncbi:hypothetical protein ACHAW5_005331 [Stephanodiscus triporus]|uniref:Uncharacterized protein n=1 Tax=Stephanodiscus triporus TaxID=2934178 RepID=A0ABD3NM26_9STRA